MELRLQDARLGEVLAESRMNPSVLSEPQVLLVKQRLSSIEHCVVCAPRCEVGVFRSQQGFCCMNRTGPLLQELPGRLFHTATASSRAFRRNGVSAPRHSASETKTRLRLTPYLRESSPTSWLERSTACA